MLAKYLRIAVLTVAAVTAGSCSHDDVTGPSGNWVHVFVQNDSTASFWSAGSLEKGPAEIPPGGRGELFWVRPDSWGGGFAVARPAWSNLGIVNYTFVNPPAGRSGFQIATIHVTANPSDPVTATSDRPDLVKVDGVTPP